VRDAPPDPADVSAILAPIDGSDCSFRALSFAAALAARFDATLDVVHFSDAETDAADAVLARAESLLADVGSPAVPELQLVEMETRPGARVGDEIVETAAEYDHVVMGHHGSGAVERVILGSAAETVVRAEALPVTVVP
jgi:nucleotide-binding universal stress UspA family protein